MWRAEGVKSVCALFGLREHMISFDSEGTRFNYRVGGIIIEDGSVLLNRGEQEEFWYVPGGRVEIGETASDALGRELREELGCEADVGRLLWMAENFFETDGTAWHEIGMYFAASLPEDAAGLRAEQFERREDSGIRLTFRWIALNELERETILPRFLVKGLQDP